MSFKAISQVLEEYHKARLTFASNICEFASWQSSIRYLEGTDVIELLAPLIKDKLPKVRRRAIMSAGRFAEKSEILSQNMMASSHFTSLFKDVYQADVSVRKVIIYFIKGLSRHNAQMATKLVQLGVIPDLVISLEDFDMEIKRDAVCALGSISKHSETLAKTVIESGVLHLLVSCYHQPDICLQQNIMKALEDLSQYHPQDIMSIGALKHITKAADCTDMKLKISALKTLACIVDASEELAAAVVESGVLKTIMDSPFITSAYIIRNLVKHSSKLAQNAVDEGACELLVHLLMIKETILSTNNSTTSMPEINQSKHSLQLSFQKSSESVNASDDLSKKWSNISLEPKIIHQNIKNLSPAVEALGHIAAHSPELAMNVISAKAIVPLVKILCDALRLNKSNYILACNSNEYLSTLCSAIWTLGQISKHSSEHSESIAAAGTLPIMVQLWQSNYESGEVLNNIESSFSLCLSFCTYLPALEPLLHLTPMKLLQPVLVQYSKILPHDAKARRLFVTTGALQKVQTLLKTFGPEMKPVFDVINSCFPDEILKYCSPDFVNVLLKHVDNYVPQGLRQEETERLRSILNEKDVNYKIVDTDYLEADLTGIEMLNVLADNDFGYRVVSQAMAMEHCSLGSRSFQIEKVVWTLEKTVLL